MRLPRSDSGTSPATIRWARPSTTAVLPTPGSPISTGLFLVRRDSTWITRRISASRPMTGSSWPSRACCGQVDAVLLQRLVGALGVLRGHPGVPADLRRTRSSSACGRGPGVAQERGGLAAVGGQADQQVLGGDVLVRHLPGLLRRGRDHGEQLPGRLGGADGQPAACGRRPGRRSSSLATRGRVGAHRAQQRRRRCRRSARSARPAGAGRSTCGLPAVAARRTAADSASWLLRGELVIHRELFSLVSRYWSRPRSACAGGRSRPDGAVPADRHGSPTGTSPAGAVAEQAGEPGRNGPGGLQLGAQLGDSACSSASAMRLRRSLVFQRQDPLDPGQVDAFVLGEPLHLAQRQDVAQE